MSDTDRIEHQTDPILDYLMEIVSSPIIRLRQLNSFSNSAVANFRQLH